MGDRSIDFCGERLTLTPERAAVWGRVLLLADTHWGKVQTHRASGVPLPDGDVGEQLARLDGLCARFDIERIIVVGDLLHAGRGITGELIDEVGAWRPPTTPTGMTVVAGNHDGAIDRVGDAWGLEVHDELDLGPFVLRHVPGSAAHRGEIAGHVHPAVSVRGDGDRVRVPCFWVRGDRLVLPAFSAFTGGERIRPDVGDGVYAVAGDSVVPIESGMLAR